MRIVVLMVFAAWIRKMLTVMGWVMSVIPMTITMVYVILGNQILLAVDQITVPQHPMALMLVLAHRVPIFSLGNLVWMIPIVVTLDFAAKIKETATHQVAMAAVTHVNAKVTLSLMGM
jgi:hypothetical protein